MAKDATKSPSAWTASGRNRAIAKPSGAFRASDGEAAPRQTSRLNAQRLSIEGSQESQRQRADICDVQQPAGSGISEPAGEAHDDERDEADAIDLGSCQEDRGRHRRGRDGNAGEAVEVERDRMGAMHQDDGNEEADRFG